MAQTSTDALKDVRPDSQTPATTPGLDEARIDFKKASENLAKQEKSNTATEIRAAVTFVEREAAHAESDIRHALEALAEELTKLADNMDKGVATGAADVKNAFAEAASAAEHKLRASGHWTGEKVGDALKAIGTWLGATGGKATPVVP